MRYVETVILTPEQAQETLVFKRYDPVTGEGYQRGLVKTYVEELSQAVRDNTWTFPVINGVRHGDKIEVVDGQNRSLAAQLAGINTIIAVWEIDESERTQVFIDWNKSKSVQPDHILNVSGLTKKMQTAFSKCKIDVSPRRSTATTICATDAAQALCTVSKCFVTFNKRVDYLKNMNSADMVKNAAKVCKVINAVADRSQPKFESNLVRMICYLIGKIEMTDEHIKRICNKVGFISSGGISADTRQFVIDAMGRQDVKKWPK